MIAFVIKQLQWASYTLFLRHDFISVSY